MGRPHLGARHAQSIRFSREQHERIARLAGRARMSVNDWVVATVDQAIAEERYPKKKEGQEELPFDDERLALT